MFSLRAISFALVPSRRNTCTTSLSTVRRRPNFMSFSFASCLHLFTHRQAWSAADRIVTILSVDVAPSIDESNCHALGDNFLYQQEHIGSHK